MDVNNLPNAMDSGIIFKTVHGSHLYGLNHSESDLDIYIVHSAPAPVNAEGAARKVNIIQTVVDGLDSTVADFKSFHIQASAGVPQALEAMFSPVPEVDFIGPWRRGFHVSVPLMSLRYKHAIEKFSAFDFKRRRHALRYALNLREAHARDGRFNPRLSEEDKALISSLANSNEYVKALLALSPIALELNVQAINESLHKEGL